MASILLVDDDPALREVVSYALRSNGFEVGEAADGEAALAAAAEQAFDVVVLDLMLPDLSGMEVCRRLRARSSVPIIMLTARDSETDRILGLEIGADDYVTKPFSVRELVSRVRAILRRRELDQATAGPRRIGDLTIDLARLQVEVDERTVRLTPSEARILALLADRPGEPLSRAALLRGLWESDHVGDEHACEVHVSNLRRKLERDPSHPRRLVTVRGEGYKLVD
jgi:two-component system response regulator RegX3